MECPMCSYKPGYQCNLYGEISCTNCHKQLHSLNGELGTYLGKIDGQHRFSFVEPFVCTGCNEKITKVQFWCDGDTESFCFVWDISNVNLTKQIERTVESAHPPQG